MPDLHLQHATALQQDNSDERLAARETREIYNDDELRDLDHERAQRLIVEQTQHLLPPAAANALADHLFACDRCFRFAQDIAHQERQSGKHKALPNP